MPFDGNGNWTSNFNAEADRDANIKIEASRFDNILLADIAQSFENCLTKDTQVKPKQNFNANNYRIINVADPATGGDAVNLSTLNTKDGTAVHKSGTETITGNKTISGSIISSGTNTWSGTNTFSGSLSAPTPTTTTATTSTLAATTGWVNTVGNNVMHLTGTESVGGSKTFTNQLGLNSGLKFNLSSQGYISVTAQNKGINIGTAPSTNTGFQMNLEDATGGLNHRFGGFLTVYNTSGTTYAQIRAYKPDGSGQTQADVSVYYPASGDPYTSAPTPSSNTDSSTKIATTAWVNNWVAANGGFSTFTKAGKGGFKLANGLIINWGTNTATDTITFAIPFSSSDSYSVATTVIATGASGSSYGQTYDLTSTGMSIVGPSTGHGVRWICIGY